MPRASDTLAASCTDTLRVDTLYLSYELDRPAPAITALHGTLNFRPQVGDTLQPFWFFKSGSPNGGNLYIDFAPYAGEATSIDNSCPIPWAAPGSYEISYDRHDGGGKLELGYFVDLEYAVGIDPGVRYCFARVRFLHRRSHLAGCTQPAGLEWSSARFGFSTGRRSAAQAGDGGVVTWNASRSVDFGWPRSTSLARPWTPKRP
jgi:hypothetical protein